MFKICYERMMIMSKKKIIAIIAAVLAVVIAVSVVFVVKNKKTKEEETTDVTTTEATTIAEQIDDNWKEGIEDVICNAPDVFPEMMLESQIIKYKLIDANGDKIPELFVHGVSTAGGHSYFLGLCAWNGRDAYEVYPYEDAFGEDAEKHISEVMLSKDEKTGEFIALADVLISSWFESDDLENYNQAWRRYANTRRVLVDNDGFKLESIINLEEPKNILGDFAGDVTERKNALETLRAELVEFEKDYSTSESENKKVTLDVYDESLVFFDDEPEAYYNCVNVEEVHELIDNYKSIVK